MSNPQGNSARWEYKVSPKERVHTLLVRIRETSADEILLDITAHEALRRDGSLRRTLASAANEFKKKIAFTFSDVKKNNESQKEISKVQSKPVFKKLVPISVMKVDEREQRGIINEPRISSSGRKIASVFTFFTGLLVTAAIFFLLPHAEIFITPNVEPINLDLNLESQIAATRVDIQSGILPGTIIPYKEAFEKAYPVASTTEKGEKASGEVLLVNKTVSEQKIKGKSRLKSESGLVYLMDEAAFLAPHTSKKVNVTAELGGTKGNLEKGQLFFVALSNDARKILYAEVTAPLSGGTDYAVSALNEKDVKQATALAEQELKSKYQKEIMDKLDKEILRNPELFQFKITDTSAVETLGTEISAFHLKGTIEANYFAIKENELLDAIRGSMLSKIGQDKTLAKTITTEMAKINNVSWDEGRVGITTKIDDVVFADLNLPSLKKKLVGRTLESAREYVASLPGVKETKVTLRPFWVKRVPGFIRNVKIKLLLPDKTLSE